MIVSPWTLGHQNAELWVDPSGGRGAWFSDQTHTALRAQLMVWSDIIAGLALLVFGWRSLTPNRPISLWAACGVGVWLTLAPVVLWAPTAASYVNDTTIGVLLIALTILIPGMPNMIMYMQHGPATPPGWSYNPSSWPQRWIMIATGFAGFLVSRYLATYQLGYTTYVADPFFGFAEGTQRVLDSSMSHAWPVSDAAFGTIAYTFEFLMGYMGSPTRWRTMPWMVAFFGILVIPLGLVHILLVISQPVVVGHWCTMCLLAAAIMLPMIPLEVDEVVAMGQHLVQAKRRGDRNNSLWAIFWMGGRADHCTPDKRSPELLDLPQQPVGVASASIWGMSFPWTLTLVAALGIWEMFIPTIFATTPPLAHVQHVVGALILTFSVIAMGEVIRLVRYVNVGLAVILAAAPFFVEGAPLSVRFHDPILALLVVALTIPRGPIRERYGSWTLFTR
jgi:uncharacterized membrane protein